MAAVSNDTGVVAVKLSSYFKMYEDGRIDRGGCRKVEPSRVVSRDVKVGEGGERARIYLPAPEWDEEKSEWRRFGVVLFYHGGAFMFDGPESWNYDAFCYEMAARSSSIWVSASYRLAPEHRLPAAIEDCINAFQWLSSSDSPDPWLASFADLSKGVFLCGISAGATLAHHVILSIPHQSLHILGLILVHPGFIRFPPTPQELACPTDDLINWTTFDACFRLVLPLHSPKSHPLFNPLLTFHHLSSSSSPFHYSPSTLVAVADQDILQFLALDYADALRSFGLNVDVFVSHGVGHVFHFAAPESEQAQSLMQKIADFIQHHYPAAADAGKRVSSE